MRRRLCFLCVCSQGLWANQSVSVCAPQWLMATPSSSECETQNKGFEAECAKKSFCSACQESLLSKSQPLFKFTHYLYLFNCEHEPLHRPPVRCVSRRKSFTLKYTLKSGLASRVNTRSCGIPSYLTSVFCVLSFLFSSSLCVICLQQDIFYLVCEWPNGQNRGGSPPYTVEVVFSSHVALEVACILSACVM